MLPADGGRCVAASVGKSRRCWVWDKVGAGLHILIFHTLEFIFYILYFIMYTLYFILCSDHILNLFFKVLNNSYMADVFGLL